MPRQMSISALLNVLLPHACLLCGTTSATTLCPACAADLPVPGAFACPCCAAPLAASAPACADCLKSPPAFDATFAVLHYAFPVDRLVQQLKFGGRHAFHRLASADFFAARMLAGQRPEGDVIVPVPLSRARLAERGFNQALEIARPLARALALPLDAHSLLRSRDTPPQSRLPWKARRRNMQQAFACAGDFSGKTLIVVDDVMTSGATLDAVARCAGDFSGKTLIVVDDVMTSGATLDAVARCLKDHGATRVVNWVAARAVRTTDQTI